jgi:YcxB-like protein
LNGVFAMQPIKIEFQLQYEDYAEALRAQRRQPRQWVILLFFGALVALEIYAAHRPIRSAASNLILPLLPWILILVAIWSFAFRLSRTRNAKPWERGPLTATSETWNRTMSRAMIVLIPLGIILTAYLSSRQSALQVSGPAGNSVTRVAQSPNFMQVIIQLVPWIVIFGVLSLVLRLGRLGGGRTGFSVNRRLWDLAVNLHRPYTMEFSESGCVIAQTFVRADYSWEYFLGSVETPSLFLLFASPVQFHIIPKRAFTDEDEANELRRLLRAKVSAPTSAFPVIIK